MLIHVLTDSPTKTQLFRDVLEARHAINVIPINSSSTSFVAAGSIIVDADLRQINLIERIRKIIAQMNGSLTRLFIVRKDVKTSVMQAYSLGANCVMFSPVNTQSLQKKFELLAGVDSADSVAGSDDDLARAICGSASGLARIFATVLDRHPVKLQDAEELTQQIIESVTNHGLTAWLDDVRRYHEGTFQHCLLVTGIAVDFGLRLGFRDIDVKRLGVAATLHDVGKGKIPLDILDKPGRLTDRERAIIETHPAAGYEALKGAAGIAPEILDAVRHHHEYLDGSGYPDGLAGPQISDLVRVLTISDIFAALIEARSYRPPMRREQAYQILCDMGDKLERPLVKAFRSVAVAL